MVSNGKGLLALGNLTFLFFVALWWYLLGLEMDFRLLERAAVRSVILRWAWFVAGAGFQFLAVYLIFVMTSEFIHVISDVASAMKILWLLAAISVAWFEFFSLRFFVAARNSRPRVPVASIPSL